MKMKKTLLGFFLGKNEKTNSTITDKECLKKNINYD